MHYHLIAQFTRNNVTECLLLFQFQFTNVVREISWMAGSVRRLVLQKLDNNRVFIELTAGAMAERLRVKLYVVSHSDGGWLRPRNAHVPALSWNWSGRTLDDAATPSSTTRNAHSFCLRPLLRRSASHIAL